MKKTLLLLALLIAALILAACNKDTSGQAYGKMSAEAVEKVCMEQPVICSCLKEKKNFDLCICLKQASTDYLMQDVCYSAYAPGEQREQGTK